MSDTECCVVFGFVIFAVLSVQFDFFTLCFFFVVYVTGMFLDVSLGVLHSNWFELKHLTNLQHIEIAASCEKGNLQQIAPAARL